MCFFKPPSMPSMPEVPQRPAISETFAATPEAPVFGTSADNTTTESSKRSGKSQLKIAMPSSGPANVSTGANGGLNTRR